MRDRSCWMRSPDISWSPSSGSISRLPRCAPSRQSPSETPHSRRPEQKFSVPSIGSSSARWRPPEAWPSSKLSSPTKVRSGRRAARKSLTRPSTKTSALVTGLPSGFQVISRRPARIRGRFVMTRSATDCSSARVSVVVGVKPGISCFRTSSARPLPQHDNANGSAGGQPEGPRAIYPDSGSAASSRYSHHAPRRQAQQHLRERFAPVIIAAILPPPSRRSGR